MTTDTTPEIDAMLMQVRDRKTAAGKPLTAVQAGRGPSTKPQEPATPSEGRTSPDAVLTPGTVAQIRETVKQTADALRAEATRLEFAVDLLLADFLEVPVIASAPAATAADKAAEKEADQRAFERQQKELAERAQAATFTVGREQTAAMTDEGKVVTGVTRISAAWTCPEHGEAVVRTSTKTGREYRACPVCGEIERK